MHERRPLVRVTQQLLNQPLMVTDHHAAIIVSAIRSQLNVKLFIDAEGLPMDSVDMGALLEHERLIGAGARRAGKVNAGKTSSIRNSDPGRKIFDYQSGIATIPITGTLTKNWGLDPYSGMTGYDGIKTKLAAAYDDPEVNAILLDIDSPGGAVAGCMDLADLIYAVAQEKPVWSVANEQMCSAAFALGSQGNELFATRTADVGSVGTLMLYANVQKAMEKEGIEVRIFRSGEDKADVNAYEPVSKDAANRIQASLDSAREIFIDTVARGRGMTKKAVRETRARFYTGDDARGIGFASDIASADQVWAKMLGRFGR